LRNFHTVFWGFQQLTLGRSAGNLKIGGTKSPSMDLQQHLLRIVRDVENTKISPPTTQGATA
jgi:hypothetical protein